MSWAAAIAGSAAVTGAIISSASAQDAADAQSGAASQGSAAQIALAREERARNEQLFAQYLGDEDRARAILDALMYGEGSYGASPSGLGGGAYTDAELQQRYPDLWTEFQGLGSDGIPGNEAATNAQGGFSSYVASHMGNQALMREGQNGTGTTITREQALQLIEGTPLMQLAQQSYALRQGLTSDTYAGAQTLAGQEEGHIRDTAASNYDDAAALAGQARTGRDTQAQENLTGRLGLEDSAYQAWLPQSQEAEDRAINLNFSRGGVTGNVGATRRGVGETTQTAAMERNLRYLQGRQAAYEPYFTDVSNSENSYWDDLGRALDERSGVYVDAAALRGGRNQAAYDRYSSSRAADLDTAIGDRASAYGDYTDFLRDRVNRGYGARGNIASGGRSYADTAIAAIGANSRAQQQAAYDRGQIQQTLYGDIARSVGDAWGTIRNRRSEERPAYSGGG